MFSGGRDKSTARKVLTTSQTVETEAEPTGISGLNRQEITGAGGSAGLFT